MKNEQDPTALAARVAALEKQIIEIQKYWKDSDIKLKRMYRELNRLRGK